MHKQHVFRVVLSGANLYERNYSANFHARCSPILLPLRLLALKLIKLLPFKHPAIDSHSWLRIAYHRIVRHTPAFFTSVKAYGLLAPHIRLYCIAFNMDFIWFVIRPERAVAPADGAEAFEGGFTEGWKGDADGFAVACCT